MTGPGCLSLVDLCSVGFNYPGSQSSLTEPVGQEVVLTLANRLKVFETDAFPNLEDRLWLASAGGRLLSSAVVVLE